MKKILVLLLALAMPTFLKAQGKGSGQERAAQQTLVRFFEALSNRDSLALKNNCTDDVVLIEYGSRWTLDTLITRGIKKSQSSDFKRTNTFEFVKTTIHKNTAWIVYNLHSSMTMNGDNRNVDWLETTVLVRVRKKWRISLLHSTRISRS